MPAKPFVSQAAAALISLMLALGGCMFNKKEDILPQDGPTMKQVYDAHFQKRGQPDGEARPLSRGAGDGANLTGYTRDAASEIESQFPRLPNPDLLMYVFPHLSEKGYPVPGYSTVIPMYETVEYALPGEKEGW